jgi:hypothetical protein
MASRDKYSNQKLSPEEREERHEAALRGVMPYGAMPSPPGAILPRARTVIDIKTPSGPRKRVAGRVSAEDTMNDIGMRNSAGTREDADAPDGTVEVGPMTPMKKGGKVKKFSRGGGIEVRGKTKGRFV